MEPEPVITCIDCLNRAHLISYPPNERGWESGDHVVYRCESCLDRWDLILGDDEDWAGDSPVS